MRSRCQLEESPFRYLPPFGLLHRLRLARGRRHSAVAFRSGRPSRFEVGTLVRLRPPEEIRATLDGDEKLRGTAFLSNQWTYRGVYEVAGHVRRFFDTDGAMHTMSGAVTLRGVTCDGAHGERGCGRACAVFFRDEWLEPAVPADVSLRPDRPRVLVRSEAEIRATLDRHGRLGGMSLRPEMLPYTGQRLDVLRRLEPPPGGMPWWKRLSEEWYVLEARCDGGPFAAEGGCDRRCAFVWLASWLDFRDD